MSHFHVFDTNSNDAIAAEWRFANKEGQQQVRTIYFALKEYRDNLTTSLAKAEKRHHAVLGVNVTKTIETSDDFEELMFLHESLASVNETLYDLVQNHYGPNGDADRVRRYLDV